jgi:WD40 repeat protein
MLPTALCNIIGIFARPFSLHSRSKTKKTVLFASNDILCVHTYPPHRAVTGSKEGVVEVWDLQKNKRLSKMVNPKEQWVRCVHGLKNGHVVCGSDDHIIRVWDVNRRRVVQTLQGQKQLN